MVLLAASICTRNGKVLLSRQFVEMSKARIEGLLAAFPKLMSPGVKQHTFVETESVRYVYQPMEKLYMLLITTKTSNILEDLETLRLFARVIPEYSRSMEEADIIENAFQIIFAFDEIVALGYRESVNLAQIRTFVEMDSHEEKVYQAVRQTQEREAKQKMREKAMKLGGKSKDVEGFVDQLLQEGENVASFETSKKQPGVTSTVAAQPQIKNESVHIKLEEKLNLTAGRDGGLESMELSGMLMLRISDENFGKVKLQLQTPSKSAIQIQPHPNIDKELLRARSQIAMKNPAKPFPTNTDVGVLKWRFQTTDDSLIPLSINCWPSENGQGGCDVNIEYELEQSLEHLELEDVVITIPIPHGVNAPVVAENDGDYTFDKRNGLQWRLPVIDATNKTGSMEFSCGGNPDDFFPVHVSFFSKKTYSQIKLLDCMDVNNEAPVKHSSEVTFYPEKYDIV